MQVTLKGNKLIIEMNLNEPKLSASGRNFTVATSKGPWESSVEIGGKPVTVVVNAFIAADEPPQTGDDQDDEDLDPAAKTKSRKGGTK
ncbi:MAG: hypothetical protein LAO19_17440 [Acidobacteriia bacterium]|nr:hypothetical protein [Terriglobia bacterium]